MQLQNIKIKQCISSIFHKNDSDTKRIRGVYPDFSKSFHYSSRNWHQFLESLWKPSEVRWWPQQHCILRTIHSARRPVDIQCVWTTSLQCDTVCEFLCVHKNMKAHVLMLVKSRRQHWVSSLVSFHLIFIDKVSYWTLVSNYLDCPAIELQEYAHPQCRSDIYSHTLLYMSTWDPPHSGSMLAQWVLEPAPFSQVWKQQNELLSVSHLPQFV